MQDNLPILRRRSVTLITMAKSPLPFNITYSQAPGIRVWTFLGVHSIFHVCLVPVYESVFRPNLIDRSLQSEMTFLNRESSYFMFCLCLEDFAAEQPLIIYK